MQNATHPMTTDPKTVARPRIEEDKKARVRGWIEEDNKALVRRWIEASNEKGASAIDEFIAPTYVHHDPSAPKVRNLAEFKQWYDNSRIPPSDLHATITGMVGEGSRVLAHLTWGGTRGTQREECTTTSTFRIANGKIVEFWLNEAVRQEKRENRNRLLSFSLLWLIPIVALMIIVARFIWPKLLLGPVDAITFALLIVVILPWLSKLIESATFPGGWVLTFRRIEQRQEDQQADITTLKFLVKHFLTEYELKHMEKFGDDKPFLVTKTDSFSDFVKELRHLLALNFITRLPGRGIRSLSNELSKGGQVDVKAHLSITDAGREYLELRPASDPETD